MLGADEFVDRGILEGKLDVKCPIDKLNCPGKIPSIDVR